jgi:hypothetical protein
MAKPEACCRQGLKPSFFAPKDDLAAQFSDAFPQITRVNSLEEILEDDSIQMVLNAGIPVERFPIGLKVMQHGKDYMVINWARQRWNSSKNCVKFRLRRDEFTMFAIVNDFGVRQRPRPISS